MKRNKNNCKHSHYIPTIYLQRVGYLWCPDCGAIREIKVIGGGFQPVGKWIYPTGKEDVLKQLESNDTLTGWQKEGTIP